MIKKLIKKIIKNDQGDNHTDVTDNTSSAGNNFANNNIVNSNNSANSASDDKEASILKKSNLNTSKDKKNMTNIQHKYLEVTADLLAKPSALCDLVESQAGTATMVFCNNPSDADFVEVILKKRGIPALKLIGFVAQEKLSNTQEKIKNGEIGALVVTDVAARGADLSLFSTIINYSLPADLDNYATRAGADQSGERTVYSIVSPSDIANLHSLKTQTNFELTQAESPSKEQLANAKLLKLKNTAKTKFSTINSALVELAMQIIADKDSEQLVSYLVQQSVEIIPQLQSQVEKLTWEKENHDQEDDYSQGQAGRKSFRNDDNRGQRNNNRRDRDSYRGQDRRSRSEEFSEQPESDNQQFDSEENSQRGNRRRRDDWRPAPTKIRDDRLYIGKGEKDGFGKEDFIALLKEKCDLDQDQLKRFLVRKNYCFADIPEAISSDVISKLDGSESKAGNIYVAKATQVITVIENEAESQSSEEAQQDSSDEQQPAA